jgi:UDP-N-acetylglucosamine 3-dehydrogenase
MGITLGVLGLNHPHARAHLPAFAGAPEIERILLLDDDPQRLATCLAQTPKAEAVGDWSAVLADPTVPVVALLLSDADSGPATVAALEAGKWVYADKPGAQTLAGLEAIVAAAQASGRHYCPCYAHRHTPAARTLARLITDGAIGEPWSFTAHWITSQIALRGPDNWLFHQSSAGGILTWLACHWFDLLRMALASEVVEVTAQVATQCREGVEVEDTATVILRMANGALGTIRAGYLLNPFPGYTDTDLYLQFEGSGGGVTYFPFGGRRLELRSSHPAFQGWVATEADLEYPEEQRRPGYSGEFLAQFLAAIDGQAEFPATEREALAVMQIIDAAYRSARTGCTVRL